jgi:hypothetical protein
MSHYAALIPAVFLFMLLLVFVLVSGAGCLLFVAWLVLLFS